MTGRSLPTRMVVAVLSTLVILGGAWAQAPNQTPLDAAFEAVEKSTLDKVAADRILTEKNIAVQAATSAAQAIADVTKKATDAKIAAERVGAADAKGAAEKTLALLDAEAKAYKEAVTKATAERDAAAKVVQEKANILNEATKKLTAERTPAEKAAGDISKAAMDATIARETAANVVNQKTAAANAVTNTASASQAAATKAETDRAAAEKALTEKTATAKAATDALAASQAVLAKVNAEKAGAEKALADLTTAAKATADAAAASQTAANNAAAEKAAADQVLTQKTNAAKTAADAAAAEKDAAKKKALDEAATKAATEKTGAEKAAAEKTAAAKAAADKAATDKTTAEKLTAEKTAAEKALAERTAAIKPATDKTAADKATVDKIVAERVAAEKMLGEKTAATKAAADKAAADKAVADKAVAEKTAAENDLNAKIPVERSARHKAVEARAIAEGGMKVLPEGAWDLAKARHLLVRAGFGGTPEQVAKLHAMGMVQAVNFLVDYEYQPTDDIPFTLDMPERPSPAENKLSPMERDRLNQRRDAQRNNDFYRLRTWWMRKMVESNRPLQEKLALFWHGHFVTEWQKIAWPHMMFAQNQLFRDHAGGNFGGLLYGIVHDPAMIVYLDNQINYRGQPNQNLARELMELFAMGVNQGYTEYDIREGARALTGYSYEHYTGQFRFNYNQHDTDPKTIFGQTGTWTGDDFVTLILQQPHTARFISGKLFEFFAYNDPDPRTVDRLAGVLRINSYELGPMLKNLFMSEEFYGPRCMGTQIKSPVQLVVGLCRDFGVKGADYNALVAWCGDMGQELLQPPNVKGWYGGRDWVNANLIFRRYNYLASLANSVPQPNNQRGIDVVGLLEGKGCTTPAQVVDYLAKSFVQVPLNDEQRKELADQLGQLPPPEEWAKQRDQLNGRFRQIFVLMLAMPEYQMT